jgi:hypothetical protein
MIHTFSANPLFGQFNIAKFSSIHFFTFIILFLFVQGGNFREGKKQMFERARKIHPVK